RGQVEPFIGQTWHYLVGREIPEGSGAHDIEHGRSLFGRELVGRRLPRLARTTPRSIPGTGPCASFFPTAPALESPPAQAQERGAAAPPRARTNGFLDKREHHLPLLASVVSSSSPPIAWTFFFSTRSAAVSASAF